MVFQNTIHFFYPEDTCCVWLHVVLKRTVSFTQGHSIWVTISKDLIHRLLDILVVECWLRVREVPGSIFSQEPRHTKDVIKMFTVVQLFYHCNNYIIFCIAQRSYCDHHLSMIREFQHHQQQQSCSGNILLMALKKY